MPLLSVVWAFFRTPLGAYLLGGLGAGLLLVGAYWKGHSAGYESAMHKVEQANAEAKQKADEAAGTVADCFARSGFVWDRATGRCVSSVP